MSAEDPHLLRHARALWGFIRENSEQLVARLELGRDETALDRALTARVKRCDPSFDWEIGPEVSGELFFAISPRGYRDLLDIARSCVSAAPVVPGWVFRAGKPARLWTRRIVEIPMEGKPREIDFDAWRFQIVDGGRIAFLPDVDCASDLGKKSLHFLCCHLIDAELGEAYVIDHPIHIALAAPRTRDLAGQTWRPIDDLRAEATARWGPIYEAIADA